MPAPRCLELLAIAILGLAACTDPGASGAAPRVTLVEGEGGPDGGGVESAAMGSDVGDAPTAEAPPPEDAAAVEGVPATRAAASASDPVRALYAIHADTTAAIRALTANTGYRTVYALDVPVLPGDVLRIATQVEMTNDYVNPVSGRLRIVAGGAPVGPVAQCNGIVSVNHHMPLWTDTVVEVTEAGTLQIRADYAAARSDASPAVTIEGGYGNLVVEQYRQYGSRDEADADGARLLAEVRRDTTEAATSFGWVRFARTRIYDFQLATGPRDLVRLHAQTTSRYGGHGNEQHGHGIFRGTTRIGPWSTENTPWEVPNVPLSSGAVDQPGAGEHAYQVSMHGVAERGAYVGRGQGHLTALRFAPASEGGRGLMQVVRGGKEADLRFIRANAPERTVASAQVDVAAGDVVRVTGMMSVLYPSNFSLGVSCYARVELRDAADAVVAAGPLTTKYVTYLMAALPLRAELAVPSPVTGTVRAVLRGRCSREGASPGLTVIDGGTALLVDQFRAN